MPADFVKINEVPVTKSGKTDRKKLVSMYANETVTKSDSDFCPRERGLGKRTYYQSSYKW